MSVIFTLWPIFMTLANRFQARWELAYWSQGMGGDGQASRKSPYRETEKGAGLRMRERRNQPVLVPARG